MISNSRGKSLLKIIMVVQEGHLLFFSKKISFDPSHAQVDQEGHRDLSAIPSFTAIQCHV